MSHERSHTAMELSKKPEVLLAEDDPEQSDMLRETLEDEGFMVDTAFSGDAALHKLLRNHYKLVIMDVRMPGMDGITVLKKFREHEKNIPVLMLSAFATESDLARYLSHGANDGLAKPYEISELLEIVGKLTPIPARKGGRV